MTAHMRSTLVMRCAESSSASSTGRPRRDSVNTRCSSRRVGWVDMEHKFDRAWAVAQGVDLTRLDQVTPESAEEASDMAKIMVDSGIHSLGGGNITIH